MTGRRAVFLAAASMIGCGARSDLSEVTAPSAADASRAPPPRDASPLPLGAHDASVDHGMPSDALLRAVDDAALVDGGSCGFEIAGAVQASIVGTMVRALAAPDEWIFVECQGTAGGSVYAFTAQYDPGEPPSAPAEQGEQVLLSSALQVGPNQWATPKTSVCAAHVLLGGVIPQPGAPYAVGEPLSMTFACSYEADAGGTYNVSAGHLAVLLSAY
jgi:hypothetical protein